MADNTNEVIEAEDHISVTDVLARICRLMRRIEKSANEITIEFKQNGRSMQDMGLNRPLYEVFEPLAEDLGFSNYAELRDNLISLCNRGIRDINSLQMKQSGPRDKWIAAAESAKGVFNASNFGKLSRVVFADHFSEIVYERLETASERLQALEIRESTREELSEALKAARQLMKAYEANGKIPSSIATILKHYLQQIEGAYQRYEDFGEEIFWATYKELFATFVQVHTVLVPDEQTEEIKQAMNDMADKMKFGLPALAITADLATLATATAALLTIIN